jgi:two-component system sensor histidine kinase PilS (NtrC family)
VGVTDGLRSLFLFAFPLAVLNSALLLYRTGAMAAATAAAVGLYAMGAMELGWLPLSLSRYRVAWLRTNLPHAPMSPLDIGVLLLVQTAAVYGTALLASHLVLELDKARRRSTREQRELATLRVRYDDVVTSMPDGILTVSATGIVTSANPAALEVLDLPAQAVVSRPLATVLPSVAPTDTILEHELIRKLANGRSQVLACRTVSLRGTLGEGSPGALVVFRDLTEERARDEKHRHHERLAAIGAMAAAVAHEIRNPLASISGAVQMLETSEGLPEMDRKLMEIVVRETHQLSAWIGEFLDFARPRPLQTGPCDLRRIALDTLEACAQDPHVTAAGIELRQGPGLQETPEDPGRMVITGDALLLRQAIWNLLVNATQAVLEGERRTVELDLSLGLDAVELTVSDSGPGVDLADMAHVFEPFYTTKGEGTGLGLATVQRYVTAHRGTVRVDRSDLGGARFVITLPRRPGGTFSAQRPSIALAADPQT